MVETLRRRADQFGLDIVMVNLWEGSGAAKEAGDYCLRWGIDATVLLDETGDYARAVGIRGVPTNVFVDTGGVVRAVGATTTEALIDQAGCLEPRLRAIGEELLGTNHTGMEFTS